MSRSLATSDEKERQTKAVWDDVTVDSFINVCVTETLNGHRPRGYFTKIGWRNVVKNFYERTGRNYGYKQLKNKWTTLKKDWQVWNDLIGNEKEIGWDPLRQTIDATSQWWDHKLKDLPEAAKFRAKGLQNVELLNILFKDVAVSGGAWAPTPSQVVLRKATSDGIEDYNDDTTGDTKFNNVESNTNEVNTSATYTQGSEKRRKKVDSKVGSPCRLFGALDRLCDVIEYRRRDLPGCSTLEVMETLRGLPGIIEGDELYMKAADILIKRENREMFVALRKPAIQITWLKQKRV
ncbi:L10-interacting MYB domain-containing protein-like [Benincasa hispida]|uniref:L10-interacting MYB domain-containing protein-like n=1 Tax=Benincasa hispida TaxID=102211 RepID=UPI0019010F34|nr:L10-interacting MYB domain-containing protein-like [Benincasa hispida]XP_038874430.1 L10-interacting MYB domain-containing protein-like [Benincasa hispida]XP_038874431.1 L10-interacting MYB domain-containing protein-like [Benincasa hispida]XP_038874432.1 L10-interacting MYB domain-containing protein-like [Benincasa hispida]